jgi:hypothetical protein
MLKKVKLSSAHRNSEVNSPITLVTIYQFPHHTVAAQRDGGLPLRQISIL